jgi:hypothetical protein
MKGIFDFIVKTKDGRYNNEKNIGDSKLILNTELENYNFVSRIGIVVGVPKDNDTGVSIGDEVIVHHNVFRRFKDIRGKEKNGRSYYKEDLYFVSPSQIYGYKSDSKWVACKGFNFIKPIKETKMFSIDFEKPLIGILKFKDPSLSEVEQNDLVGFRPGMEYEFIVDNQKLYRVPSNQITIKYEYQGDEEEYNPSWT